MLGMHDAAMLLVNLIYNVGSAAGTANELDPASEPC